jgi:hypothetical protein
LDFARNYLSAPLAFNASISRDFSFSASQEFLQSVNFVFLVDVDLEGEVGPVAHLGPGERSTVGKVNDVL